MQRKLNSYFIFVICVSFQMSMPVCIYDVCNEKEQKSFIALQSITILIINLYC